jgi:hypothetical protein
MIRILDKHLQIPIITLTTMNEESSPVGSIREAQPQTESSARQTLEEVPSGVVRVKTK